MQGLLWPFVHFAALVGFIVYKAKTPFGQFIQTRHKEVFEGLNRSKLQAAEAAQKKAEIESKLSGLESEKRQIIAEWKEREIQQIKAAQESSSRVVAQLRSDAELNKKALEETFRSETAKAIGLLVLARAEQKIKAAMNAEVHKKVNDGFIRELTGA